MALKDTLDQMDLTDIFRTFHSKAWNIHSSQVHMEHTPEQTTYWNTNQPSTSTKRSRSYTVHIFRPQCYETQNQPQKKKFGKVTNTWRLKNILLKNEWAKQAVKEEIKKYKEVNENDSTTTQNLWDAAKAVIRGRYTAIQAFLKKNKGLRYTT